jgi:hypothetical protein
MFVWGLLSPDALLSIAGCFDEENAHALWGALWQAAHARLYKKKVAATFQNRPHGRNTPTARELS